MAASRDEPWLGETARAADDSANEKPAGALSETRQLLIGWIRPPPKSATGAARTRAGALPSAGGHCRSPAANIHQRSSWHASMRDAAGARCGARQAADDSANEKPAGALSETWQLLIGQNGFPLPFRTACASAPPSTETSRALRPSLGISCSHVSSWCPAYYLAMRVRQMRSRISTHCSVPSY
jgi:hypothetical protein